MLYGKAPAQTMHCLSPSADLLSILRSNLLSEMITFDYNHSLGSWTKKDGSDLFALAASILKTECLFGTWMSVSKTLYPIQFAGIDGYIIGELDGRYLVASSIALYNGTKTAVFI